jgi:signal transduction histidine kinase
VDWKAKDRGLWLTLAALTVLLVVLAALQYRWTSEIGRAEADRRQTQLERSTWRFGGAFDRETGRLLMAFFRMEPPPPDGDPRALLRERLAAWRRDEHAALLSAVLLATRSPSGVVTLEACGAEDADFHAVPWTAELEPLRQRLQSTGSGRDGFFVRPGSLVDHPLALAFPFVDAGSGEPHAERWGRFRVTGVVLLQLDQAYLNGQLFPQLAEANFGPVADSEFDVAVVRRDDRSIVFSTDPARTGTLPPLPGDVQRSLPGRGRVGPDRREAGSDRRDGVPGPRLGERPADDAPAPPGEGRRPAEEESPWMIVARHRGGSLEQTVARVRARNLAVGFGVLALLGATGALLATGAQRARRLARQQMEFVAGVTHELNTPLAAIRSAGQNLADGIVTDPTQVRRYGGLIEKEGGRLTGLVAQVLDFAGIESGSRAYASEPLSVATLVDEVLRDHRLALDQAGMTVETDLASDLPQVRGDAAALRRALDNLVANAVKFAASGGWLAVRVASRPDEGTVVVRVEDRGPGIPRDERERVFEPFFRGPAAERNATPGSGLGLSLVRHVVRAHGGRVRVEGREGGGAAVVLELPVASPEKKA